MIYYPSYNLFYHCTVSLLCFYASSVSVKHIEWPLCTMMCCVNTLYICLVLLHCGRLLFFYKQIATSHHIACSGRKRPCLSRSICVFMLELLHHETPKQHHAHQREKKCFTARAVVEPFSNTEGTIIGGVHHRSCSSLHISQTSVTSWETPWWGEMGWTCVSAQRESFQTIKAELGVPKRSVLSRC